uniref:Uncharacterized protein n=1 Tax=Anguilla anguilla TaxID=7936 RepID=A0A0E9U7Z6_ANGAN
MCQGSPFYFLPKKKKKNLSGIIISLNESRRCD